MAPKQRLSSPINPNRRTMPIQADDNEAEKRSSIVNGVPQSKVKLATDRVRHDIASCYTLSVRC